MDGRPRHHHSEERKNLARKRISHSSLHCLPGVSRKGRVGVWSCHRGRCPRLPLCRQPGHHPGKRHSGHDCRRSVASDGLVQRRNGLLVSSCPDDRGRVGGRQCLSQGHSTRPIQGRAGFRHPNAGGMVLSVSRKDGWLESPSVPSGQTFLFRLWIHSSRRVFRGGSLGSAVPPSSGISAGSFRKRFSGGP